MARPKKPRISRKATPRDSKKTDSESSPEAVAKPKKKRPLAQENVRISHAERIKLYAAAPYLPTSTEEAVGLRLKVVTYLKDPSVAETYRSFALDENYLVDWEPGLSDGPTSARFAVVDFSADTGQLAPPVEWDIERQVFSFEGKDLDKETVKTFQFHQLMVWALVQHALQYFEDGSGLGRRIPWAFEGNRLIVVPHAGYGENAFYDRESKSLQFYYFGSREGTVYTCLSTDIVYHEFAHAVLDGVRPYYNASIVVQTAAFHEFMGDLTAILLVLRNNEFRNALADQTHGKMEDAEVLASLARQFGEAVTGKPYLRSALNKFKMSKMVRETSAHVVSQVLVGAMFDVLMKLVEFFQKEPPEEAATDTRTPPKKKRKATPKEAFWRAVERMQRMAIQPLDLLPPVDVTFKDYARAVCRAEQLSNPTDPEGHLKMLIEVFRERQIFDAKDVQELEAPQFLYSRLRLKVYLDIDEVSRSRASAYRFLDNNREELLIPAFQDFFVADLYDANKRTREGARLPRQVVLEYLWREDVPLVGPEFGKYNGQTTTMLCGGTLVVDDSGNVLAWARKPGTQDFGKQAEHSGEIEQRWKEAVEEGHNRKREFLATLKTQIAAGRVGVTIGGEKGFLGTRMPPLEAEDNGGAVQFRLSPHLHLNGDTDEDEETWGGRRWETSS